MSKKKMYRQYTDLDSGVSADLNCEMREIILTEFAKDIIQRHDISVTLVDRGHRIIICDVPYVSIACNLDLTKIVIISAVAFPPKDKIHRNMSFELADPECFEKLQVVIGKILEKAPNLKKMFGVVVRDA